jgi:hypothetical protein
VARNARKDKIGKADMFKEARVAKERDEQID